jgi:putative two-component system response regulator
LGHWARIGTPATLGIAAALVGVITGLRLSGPSSSDTGSLLYVLPIAFLALRFGLRGGLIAAVLTLALVEVVDVFDHYHSSVGTQADVYRAVGFLLLGALVGTFVDSHRKLDRQASSYYDESLDMLATANLDGRFTHVNPAWERTLGHSAETMCSRPFIEFVHPDDRAASLAAAAPVLTGSGNRAHESANNAHFRNRYRAANGTYRWLEWTAVRTHEGVIHAAARDVTLQHNAELAVEVSRAETLQRLALAAEYRDDDTFRHTERVGAAAADIGMALGLCAAETRLLGEAAPLHDVGKLAISDAILLKPGSLTTAEYETMKTHTTLGARLLSGSNSPVLQAATVIAASHHERWDGTGYPAGLAGEAIPLEGRVTAVADVFDALTHDRPYKSAWTNEQAIAEIRRTSGTQFDPRVVDAFLVTRHGGAVAARIPRSYPGRRVLDAAFDPATPPRKRKVALVAAPSR